MPLQFITNDDWHKVKSSVVNVFVPLVSTKERDFEDKGQNSCIMSLCFCLTQIERPLQKHGGRLGHDEKYCGSCFGAEEVPLTIYYT